MNILLSSIIGEKKRVSICYLFIPFFCALWGEVARWFDARWGPSMGGGGASCSWEAREVAAVWAGRGADSMLPFHVYTRANSKKTHDARTTTRGRASASPSGVNRHTASNHARLTREADA